MTVMSSSRNVIKTGSKAVIESFSPPVQSLFRPSRRKVEGEVLIPQGNFEPLPGERLWIPPKAEKEDLEEQPPEKSEEENHTKEEIERLLAEAKEEADKILAEAREQSERLEKAAFDQGFQEGYNEGFRQGLGKAEQEHGTLLHNQLADFQHDMERAITSVEEAKARSLRTYLEELKECAIAVAEKVIHISLKSSGGIIRRMIVAETEKLKKTAWVKIYMEKTDYEMMMEGDADVISELSRLSDNIKFIVMDKDQSGNCIIETPEEIIDISVDAQLQNIREILGTIKN